MSSYFTKFIFYAKKRKERERERKREKEKIRVMQHIELDITTFILYSILYSMIFAPKRTEFDSIEENFRVLGGKT